jgi:hypothetical protein
MRPPKRRLNLSRVGMLAVLAVVTLVVPAANAVGGDAPSKVELEHISESVAMREYLAHPGSAPSRFDPISQIQNKAQRGRRVNSCTSNANKDVFNCDIFGLPQNEESVGSCPTNDNYVLEGTNDYRGILDPEGNFTGWHWSVDGAHSIQNEGLLPPVTLRHTPGGSQRVPSGGDPVDFIPAGCDSVYAASLAYSATDPFGDNNGVAVYKSTPAILSSCQPFLPDGTTNPECWPVRRLVAETDATHFLDKEWMFVGVQNGVRYVWVTYTDFAQDPSAPLGYTGASIKAVRCDENLVTCTEPIPISTLDEDVQFSDVTVGPDGRAYITWARVEGEFEGTPQVFTIKYRAETAPGSGVFEPEHVVQVVPNAIPFGGLLHANDFRVATEPKNDVVMVNGHPRVFVIYDECTTRLFGTICEEPSIKLTYSDDDGVTWSPPTILSNGGDNYFPSISADRTYTTNNVAATWFSNLYDLQFHNQQDVQATSINPLTGEARGLKRITSSSNETESDPILGGVFIGDYIEGVLIRNRFYVGFNANYRKVPLIGGFFNAPDQPVFPVNQQDNYVGATALN